MFAIVFGLRKVDFTDKETGVRKKGTSVYYLAKAPLEFDLKGYKADRVFYPDGSDIEGKAIAEFTQFPQEVDALFDNRGKMYEWTLLK